MVMKLITVANYWADQSRTCGYTLGINYLNYIDLPPSTSLILFVCFYCVVCTMSSVDFFFLFEEAY